MMSPRYRDVKAAQIPEARLDSGVVIKVVCGRVGSVEGPVRDIVIEPEYLDVSIPSRTEFRHNTPHRHTAFAYVIRGRGYFCKEKNPFTYEVVGDNYFDMKRDPYVGNHSLILFEDGDEIRVFTEDEDVRFLLISGGPITEPIAWYGPIVMNTQEELRIAFEEYQNGTFLKHT